MGKLLDAVRRLRATIKLDQGKCGECGKVLRDDARSIHGFRACSDDCADRMWLDQAG